MHPQLDSGTLVGGCYRVRGPLATGGFARLYRARDERDGAEVVIKAMLGNPLEDEATARDRFAREAEIARRMTHANTVRTLDFGQLDDGTPYLVMERLRGRRLDLVIPEGPHPPWRVRRLLLQILGSLAEAHGFGVVHRDLKPGNIIVCGDDVQTEQAKVIDFGLAKPLDIGDLLDSPSLTADGMLVGTPGYMAPELLEDAELTPLADLYVVGIIGHELLTGARAYTGSPFERVQQQARGNPEAPADEVGSTALYGVLKRLLARQPGKRCATAGDAVAALEALADPGASSPGRWWRW